jgi:hypothetical protein
MLSLKPSRHVNTYTTVHCGTAKNLAYVLLLFKERFNNNKYLSSKHKLAPGSK